MSAKAAPVEENDSLKQSEYRGHESDQENIAPTISLPGVHSEVLDNTFAK